jgi:3-phenylpropionate/trans-cinnamate dioxygenase ferredoxin reductase subunit
MGHVVIVGAGHGGTQLASSLREQGFTGSISLLGDEPGLPYQRPPLSKDFLVPGAEPAPLPIRGERFFTDQDIDHRPGCTVTAVDPQARTVTLAGGATLTYTDLVLATGARNRTVDAPGGRPAGVHHLRTLSDARDLHRRLASARRAVVVGGGFIGLEFAAAARAHGVAVTVLELAPRVLARALSEAMSHHLAEAHAAAGVDLRPGQGLAGFDQRDGHVTAVVGTDGRAHPADLVVVGVGVVPNTELAAAAGLAVEDGVVVDEHLRTSDEHIWAIGDCASFPSVHTGTRTRLESVQNATDQAAALARTLVGAPTAYEDVPWFWSVQGRRRLQIAGIVGPAGGPEHTVVRGDPATGKFSIFRFREQTLAAVESVDSPADHLAARRVLTHRLPLTPDRAGDPGFDLKAYSRQPSAA